MLFPAGIKGDIGYSLGLAPSIVAVLIVVIFCPPRINAIAYEPELVESQRSPALTEFGLEPAIALALLEAAIAFDEPAPILSLEDC